MINELLRRDKSKRSARKGLLKLLGKKIAVRASESSEHGAKC